MTANPTDLPRGVWLPIADAPAGWRRLLGTHVGVDEDGHLGERIRGLFFVSWTLGVVDWPYPDFPPTHFMIVSDWTPDA